MTVGDIVRLGLRGDGAAENATARIEIRFSQDKSTNAVRLKRRDYDCDRAAHAVPEEVSFWRVESVQ